MATLDLSRLEGAPDKVKLLDGKLYDIAQPEQLGALPLQRIAARKRAAEELMGKPDASDEDVEEMISLLVDVLDVMVPDADREELGKLPLQKMELLIDHFRQASPPRKEAEATSAVS